MTKEEILIEIEKDIKDFEKLLKKENKELEKTRKLPDDPSLGVDVFDDGILNENPYLKTMLLENHQHVIGFYVGSLGEAYKLKYFLTVTDEQKKLDDAENERIDKVNKKTMRDLSKRIMKNLKNK